MNRKERRKLLRDGINPKSVMDIYTKELYDRAFSDGIKHSADSIMVITAYMLHTHCGFGKQRLPEIMQWIHESIDAFNTGHLIPSDIDTMKEELEKYGCFFEKNVS